MNSDKQERKSKIECKYKDSRMYAEFKDKLVFDVLCLTSGEAKRASVKLDALLDSLKQD